MPQTGGWGTVSGLHPIKTTVSFLSCFLPKLLLVKLMVNCEMTPDQYKRKDAWKICPGAFHFNLFNCHCSISFSSQINCWPRKHKLRPPGGPEGAEPGFGAFSAHLLLPCKMSIVITVKRLELSHAFPRGRGLLGPESQCFSLKLSMQHNPEVSAYRFFLVFEAKLTGSLPCTLLHLELREASHKQFSPKKDTFILAHPDSTVQISFPQNRLHQREDMGAG